MPGKKPAAKKGPGAGAIAAMKARREKELEEERERQAREEEEARKEEEARVAAEEEAKRKAERKAQRAEENKDKGKQMTPAEKKKAEENRKKLEQMQRMGVAIPEAALRKLRGEVDDSEPVKKEKPKTETLAQKKKRLEKEKAERDALAAKAAAEAREKNEKKDDFDDWEEEADDLEEKPAEPETAAEPEPEPEETAAPSVEHADPTAPLANKGDLRSPICCVLGHVDTGKTKLLDYIRRTNVQTGEAGGITQQIGASFFPAENLLDKTRELKEHLHSNFVIDVPGLLVIDTPGHEAFANLRGRGSALCDIAILVIDIMHGLEPQTRESLQLLRDRKTPFVVALNKIDRLYDWEANKAAPFPITYQKQKAYVQDEFERRLNDVVTQLQELGLNSCLYSKNKNFLKNVSLVPTSAHTGEGVPDLLMLMVQLTQRHMGERLTLTDELRCSLLEVKKVEGHGVTIDVILVDGVLKEGDTIMVCGLNGPIVTQIRALLTPHPMKEIRIKGDYLHHKQIRAAQGIKIAATGLEEAVPGTPVLRVRDGDNIEKLQEEVMAELGTMVQRTQGENGVAVQASTLGALEALLVFLKECEIPVSTVGVGELHKKDIMRAVGIKEKNPKFAVILCFDIEISKEAKMVAEKEDIQIFTADIIYHLQDKFKAYLHEYSQKLIEKNQTRAVFPCYLQTMPDKVFRAKDPIVLGMRVLEGQLRPGTPLFIWKVDEKTGKKVPLTIGKVETCERDHKEVKKVEKGQEAAVKIKAEGITFGRQVQDTDEMISLITRDSIDALKESFKEEMSKSDWAIIIKLKKQLGIL
eukprot:TRINITY_DN50484_c0_g1_i1.p1 TRINITY_DN50484_c0_g1~~TRINITY_DN50484_c0_g1_i1.p1  ORF type:complete len:811 (+),score=425.80 TRINITY_DN50484_c0_g1_i1:116-2548(+)